MKNCPKCKSERLVKNGFQRGKQRYKCKECGFNPTVEEVGYPEEFRAKILAIYLEGVGIRAISRIFKISVGSVINWIREAGENLGKPKQAKSVEIMELDEMHHWVGSKKRQSGSGSLFVVFLVESSTTKLVVAEHKLALSYGKE